MNINPMSLHHQQSNTNQSVRTIAELAFSPGAIAMFTIGFSDPDVIHHFTHDARHVARFPCH